MVTAPPAVKIPKSAATHSYLVILAIATRSSFLSPSPINPAAICTTCSLKFCQEIVVHPVWVRRINADELGATRTRSCNMCATDLAGVGKGAVALPVMVLVTKTP